MPKFLVRSKRYETAWYEVPARGHQDAMRKVREGHDSAVLIDIEVDDEEPVDSTQLDNQPWR